ncbi:MAG: ABC transporter ATP-binding protein, partial [Candidatus Omnitrophica bacterium]|nr:ABC transporter ATP-binding protein [Candidatus Omnitrophota bacterium]
RKFDEIVAFSEIEKFIDTPAKRYSSGMYVRLAFAVAAHLEPEILLVDEVLAVGDVAFQQKCMRKMQDVAKQGRTVLFVSHSMAAISMLCTRAILLEQGRITSSDRPLKVIDKYISPLGRPAISKEAELFFKDILRKKAQITSIRISRAEGKPSSKFDIYDTIRVNIGFTLRKHFPNIFVGCTIRNSIGQVVYATNDMDWVNYKTPKMKGVFPKEPGSYKASVTLPAPLLHPGIYELICLLNIPNVGRVDFQDEIFVEVTDIKGSFVSFPFERDGVLALPLEWHVEQTEKS